MRRASLFACVMLPLTLVACAEPDVAYADVEPILR
ncbi:MAG: hypothetical protein ACI9VR_000886 [Cognaticolwellia sp.]|jgi:hypothetical protein